jgi:hypothetical protein
MGIFCAIFVTILKPYITYSLIVHLLSFFGELSNWRLVYQLPETLSMYMKIGYKI